MPWNKLLAGFVGLCLATQVWAAKTPVDDLKLDPLPVAHVKPTDANKPMIVFMSGDGGWAELDQRVSGMMEKQGMPVVGWSTLTYFWEKKNPEQTTKDLERILDYYSKTWHRDRIMLIGYSFGAEVIPFVLNRLSPEYRSKIVGAAMFVPSTSSNFVIHVSDWLPGSGDDGEYLTLPEMQQIKDVPFLCLYSDKDPTDLCPMLDTQANVKVVQLSGGHNFDKHYSLVADTILKTLHQAISPDADAGATK